jgi:hypothetical protein
VARSKLTRQFQIETERNAIGIGRKGGWCVICAREIGDKLREARYFMYWQENGNVDPFDYVDQNTRDDDRSCGYLCANHDRLIGKANLLRFGYDKLTAQKMNTAICSNDHSYWSKYNKVYSFNGST